jgi:hypothetical protein
MKFKVEATFTVDGTACVMGRRSGSGDFAVSSSSTLDGVPILQRLEVPRKLLRPEQGLDDNVFVFSLANAADLARFHKYDVVELVP